MAEGDEDRRTPGRRGISKRTFRRVAIPVAILVIGLPVGIGTVMAMGDHSEPEEVSPFTSVSQSSGPKQVPRAQPRWELVSAMAGTGSAQRDFTIAARAIQWRADWRCTSGTFRMSVARPSQVGQMLASSDCPDVGTEGAMGTGRGSMQVNATGGWRVVVKQQVDTALVEPPLPGMTKTALLARGRFHDVQKDGEGTVSVYRLASGRLALRFEDFYTSPSPGLRVWLSRARNVQSTLQARQAKYADAGAIRSTLGSYNQMLPASISAGEFRTIVIWCPTVLIAFSAAPLANERTP